MCSPPDGGAGNRLTELYRPKVHGDFRFVNRTHPSGGVRTNISGDSVLINRDFARPVLRAFQPHNPDKFLARHLGTSAEFAGRLSPRYSVPLK
jgi:hypothetical protein